MNTPNQQWLTLRTRNTRASVSFFTLVLTALALVHTSHADTIAWQGNPGVSVTTNWSDAANWTSSQQTYYNQVRFTGSGTNVNSDVTTVNTFLDSATAASQMPIWQLDFANAGGNYVTAINPGVTLQVAAGNGWMYVGASGAPTNAAEVIKFVGDGATISLAGGLVVQQSGPPLDTHNVTLDMSGLGNFQLNGNRLLVASTGNRGHGTVYLAKTSSINLGSDITICWQGGTSNSLPCALYLGQTNTISTGAGNNYIVVGQSGGTNAILAFNPAYLNTVPPAQVSIASSVGSGRGNLWVAANNGSQNGSAYGIADFSGGLVTMMEDSIQLGQGGDTTVASSLGVLSFDNGTIDANTIVAGNQTASGGGVGIGQINVGTNATQGANATLTVNDSLTLASVAGTLSAGSAGTLNINGGVVNADVINSGGGTATITMNKGRLTTRTAGTPASPLSTLALTNSTLFVKIPSVSSTNIVTGTLTTSGASNVVSVVSLPSIGSYPFQRPIIDYSGSIGGTGFNFALGALPPLAVGYLSNNVANGSVDLVLTDGPRNLAWTGANSGNWDTSTANWFAGSPIAYSDGSFVSFLDGATTSAVNLTAAFQPASVIVSNISANYTFSGSGSLGGSSPLIKTGSGKLTLDNSGNNNYTGGTTISAGTLQVGANDANGNLPTGGSVVNNGALVFARNDAITVNNTISGAGSVTQSGGNSLVLSGVNSFSGPLLVTNASTLQIGNASAVGGNNGATVIANGSTLDINGYYLTSEPIVVAGSGVGGSGVIVNNGGAVYGATTNLTLTGDSTFNIASRWDLGGSSGGVLNSGGQPYDVTLVGSGYYEWKRLKLDTNFGDINIVSGNLGAIGSTTFGNPTNTLTIATGAGLTFYADDTAVTVNKRVIFNDGATIANGWWQNTISGPMLITNSAGGGYCEFNIGSYSLTLSGALTGNGIIYKTGSETLVLSGNSPTFAGGAYILGGTVSLNGTFNNALGIILSSGRLNLNGTLSGAGVTSSGGTTIAGSGSSGSALDVGGSLLPGDNGIVGTLTTGSLILEGGASVTSDLGSTAAGSNDLVQVNGNLTANGNTLYINPIGSSLQNGAPYTLITYTGTFSGSFGSVTTVSPSPYTMVLTNITSTSPKKIQVIVTGGQSSVLAWNNGGGTGQWDSQASANWTNRTTHASPDVFYSLDTVIFDDSITNWPTPTTTVTIPSGQNVSPAAITNNSTLDYTINGDGQIGGGANLVKRGTGTLNLAVAGSFTGTANIAGGTVKTISNALPSVASITITNGGTLDMVGRKIPGNKPVTLAGAGVGDLGALVNSGGDFYDQVFAITLVGDATLGGSSRWDLVNGSTITGPYKVTINRASSGLYAEWDTVALASNVGDVELATGKLGVKGMGNTMGNSNAAFIVDSGCELTFWNSGAGANSGFGRNYLVRSNAAIIFRTSPNTYFDGNVTLETGAQWAFFNGSGSQTMNGIYTLNGNVHLVTGDSPIIFTNVITGPGGFVWDAYNNPVTFTAVNSYSGPTVIGGGLTLVLSGSGSISQSTPIFFGGSSPNSIHLNVSGRPDKTLTLASGQTLAGVGAIAGNLVVSANATVAPAGTNTTIGITTGGNLIGAITATNNVALNGTVTLKLNGSGTNDSIQAGNSITYGGTMNLVNVSAAPLAAGDSFKVFNAASYGGTFASLVPATPGTGLLWDTSSLVVDGTLKVIAGAVSQPGISSVTVSGGNVILSGTNGPANANYYVLTSTNLTQPRASWTVLATNQFSGTGTFSYTNIVSPGEPRRFYLLQVP